MRSNTNHRKKWYFSGEVVLGCGKAEDRWLSLITRGMTTLPRAKRTSRIVSFLMVIGITLSGKKHAFQTEAISPEMTIEKGGQ